MLLDRTGQTLAGPNVLADSCPTLHPLAIGPSGEILTICGICAQCLGGAPGEALELRYFDPSGLPLSSPITLAPSEPSAEIGPVVAAVLESGHALVVRAEHVALEQPSDDRISRGVLSAQLLEPLAAGIGELVQVSANTTDEIDTLDAARTRDGEVVVWWSAFTGERGFGDVLLRRFAPSGEVVGSVVALADSDVNEYHPLLAMLDDGEYLVSFWRPTDGPDVFAEQVLRHLDGTGTTLLETTIDSTGELGPYTELLAFASSVLGLRRAPDHLIAQPYIPVDGLLPSRLRVATTNVTDSVADAVAVSFDEGEHLLMWRQSGRLRARALASSCHPSPTTMCLRDGRFRVESSWTNFSGSSGNGEAQPLSPESGAFAFFNPEKPDVVVKLLDGGAVNDHHWLFWSSLSSVAWSLEVTDLELPAQRLVANPSAVFGSGARTDAFPLDRAALTSAHVVPVVPSPPPASQAGSGAPGPCGATTTFLCLLDGRYEVSAIRHTPAGPVSASARALTDGGGAFWFFREDNLEVFVKLIDGSLVNDSLWAFGGGLTNLPFTFEIRDTASGATRTYRTSSGAFASFGDVGALPISALP